MSALWLTSRRVFIFVLLSLGLSSASRAEIINRELLACSNREALNSYYSYILTGSHHENIRMLKDQTCQMIPAGTAVVFKLLSLGLVELTYRNKAMVAFLPVLP